MSLFEFLFFLFPGLSFFSWIKNWNRTAIIADDETNIQKCIRMYKNVFNKGYYTLTSYWNDSCAYNNARDFRCSTNWSAFLVCGFFTDQSLLMMTPYLCCERKNSVSHFSRMKLLCNPRIFRSNILSKIVWHIFLMVANSSVPHVQLPSLLSWLF